MSYSKTILVGRAGKDAELFVGKDFEICKFSMATSESYKDKSGDWKEVVEWHNIVYSRRGAKSYSDKIKKGDLVVVEGKKKTRSYENKDGVKVYIVEIKADLLRHFKLERKENREEKIEQEYYQSKEENDIELGIGDKDGKHLPDSDDTPF